MTQREVPAPAQALSGEAVELARAVVREHFDSESEAFEDILVDYAADPDGTVRGVRLRAPVGIGIELAAVTPYVLTAAGMVAGVLVEKATEGVVDSVRQWLKRVWARRRDGEGARVGLDDVESGQVITTITVNLVVVGADEETARSVARHVVAELVTGKPAEDRTAQGHSADDRPAGGPST